MIELDDLNDAEVQAYMIADNQLTDRSAWDDDALGQTVEVSGRLVAAGR